MAESRLNESEWKVQEAFAQGEYVKVRQLMEIKVLCNIENKGFPAGCNQ